MQQTNALLLTELCQLGCGHVSFDGATDTPVHTHTYTYASINYKCLTPVGGVWVEMSPQIINLSIELKNLN